MDRFLTEVGKWPHLDLYYFAHSNVTLALWGVCAVTVVAYCLWRARDEPEEEDEAARDAW